MIKDCPDTIDIKIKNNQLIVTKMHKDDAYKTYYELSALKDSMKKDQSIARKDINLRKAIFYLQQSIRSEYPNDERLLNALYILAKHESKVKNLDLHSVMKSVCGLNETAVCSERSNEGLCTFPRSCKHKQTVL